MKQYSFLNTVLLVNGVEISGFDEGDDVIAFERINDTAQHKIGTDGEMSIALSADRSGTVTFRLMQTSFSNDYLSGIVNLQENGVFSVVSVMFKDTQGGDLIAGTAGYMAKPASVSRGTNVNAQEWVITLEKLDFNYSGA